ncbi:hypothetical protein [Stackebrandtia nassauensis]|uniref:WD40 repeat, subgroup n=1 Tax=Stackebrandtia nassauensis (strain DSM 44728 / CIP 108903 / NRRL B-16338 / NBRC 102104 / LLR-40K-21) TaxID=446470 RepID=D3Q8L7_STANL|nr:hypothetical protein [Stackebrandtia nassauensis]ADD44459.1 hypothetical protein Snas_4818 [Stackebrandtia nassauensis DSM 44728]
MRLEQIISRYHPDFDVAEARLGLGLDGLVYLVYARTHPLGHLIRVDPSGNGLREAIVGTSCVAVAATADGTVAVAEVVGSARVTFWDKNLTAQGQVGDFLHDGGNTLAPSDVQAGPSGDFYAIDQYRLKVRRMSPRRGVVDTFGLERLNVVAGVNQPVGLRVDEERGRLVTAWNSAVIWASDFDGTPLWTKPIAFRPAGRFLGAYDLAADGSVHVLESGNRVRVFGLDGVERPAEAVTLKGSALPVTYLRVHGDELVVKRVDRETLFEVYERGTGELRRRVPAELERLTAEYPDPVWEAGKPVPLTITHDSGPYGSAPGFRAWLRPLGVPEFTALPITGQTVTPSADAGGLYQLRVSPDLRGGLSEYVLDGVVEVQKKDAIGTISILTKRNRFYFGKGEPIPFTVEARTTKTPPTAVTVRVRHGDDTVKEVPVTLDAGTGDARLTAADTGTLTPGRYTLDVEVPGFTVAPQYLELGPGIAVRPTFHITRHGDYKDSLPVDRRVKGFAKPSIFADLPDDIDTHLVRSRKLGINLLIDRLGKGSFLPRFTPIIADKATHDRLVRNPSGVSPGKVEFEDALWRAIAGYGAYGIEEQSILLTMDAGLPLGTFGDTRTPAEMLLDIEDVVNKLRDYPAFRGWSWAANWWLIKLGAAAAKDETERQEYVRALAAAKETGAWATVLDTVSDRIWDLKVAAEALFHDKLTAIAPGQISAITGPYRALGTHPPVNFANADEVDLHYQAEQIPPPLTGAHQVDFYRRPGKPARGHPEPRNDDGTGAMFAAALFPMAMRGVDGTGSASPFGDVGSAHGGVLAGDPRSDGTGPRPGDVRSGGAGKTTMLRAIQRTIARYGSTMAGTEPADAIAIVVSSRMQRIDEASGNGDFGGYFSALFEAYNTCLYAHRPASFVFTEDLTPDTLAAYRAVLVVGQKVTLEPPLAAALDALDSDAVKVYFDDTCRPELMPGYAQRLGVSFNRVATDPSAKDDSAHWRFREYFITHSETLRELLDDVVPPVAGCDNPEVLLSERRDGEVRYVWAVNNTVLDWEPGLTWRVSMFAAHRVPVVAELDLRVPLGYKVFDVYAGKTVGTLGGKVTADLRTMPVRLYAILPLLHPLPEHRTPVAQDWFGPHVRDIAIADDGRTGVLSCFNWDHNLYGLDLRTGSTRWREKVGHFFAFGPTAYRGGIAAQGYDVDSPEGYHLYLVNPAGEAERRFALFGLPKRATEWSTPEWGLDTGLNNFAVSPDGAWVATCGDLGLAVWDRDGTRRWTDAWWSDRRDPLRLLAFDASTLLTYVRGTVTARAAADGATLWSLRLAETGHLQGAAVSADRSTLLFWSTTLGGRMFVVRDQTVTNTIATGPTDEVSVSADGSLIATTADRQLLVWDANGGLVWTYTGDDLLRRPEVSPDGERIAVGSELGTLTVLDRHGAILCEKDLLSLPVSTWLPGGDLLVATWTGEVTRFDGDLDVRWSTKLAPTETDAAAKLRAPDPTPTTRVTGWGNAEDIPLSLTPNLLAATRALINPLGSVNDVPYTYTWRHPLALLRDGKPDAPPTPWLQWNIIGVIDSPVYKKLAVDIDAVVHRMHVTGVTFAEDPDHPESWLRDVRLRYWDIEAEAWRDGPMLLSDAPLHSHVLPTPIDARRFQLVTTGGGSWPVGNLRLGELVFHGSVLGSSHPDVIHDRPAAVLFDEQRRLETLVNSPFVDYHYGDAVGDGRLSIELTGAVAVHPTHQSPYPHRIPDWDFTIVEHPSAPGQYRHLQFAWKATSGDTTGIRIRIGHEWPGAAVDVVVGDDPGFGRPPFAEVRVPGDRPPTQWRTVRLDLWALKVPDVQGLSLRATGGGARFDQFVLGRTPADLPEEL